MHLTEGEMESYLCKVDFVNKNKRATHASGPECECCGKGEEYSNSRNTL